MCSGSQLFVFYFFWKFSLLAVSLMSVISFQLITTLALKKFQLGAPLSHFQVERAACAACRSNTICRSLVHGPLRLDHASPSAHNFVDHLIFRFHMFDCCGAYRDDLSLVGI
jgi:hypothetical protein